MQKPTTAEFTAAVLFMAESVPFFPGTDAYAEKIRDEMARFVNDRRQLAWLVDNAVLAIPKWTGRFPQDLRGIYCTRYTPADGQEENCLIPGFKPSDGEAKYVASITSPAPYALLEGPKEDPAVQAAEHNNLRTALAEWPDAWPKSIRPRDPEAQLAKLEREVAALSRRRLTARQREVRLLELEMSTGARR